MNRITTTRILSCLFLFLFIGTFVSMINYKEYYEAVTNSCYVYSRENFQIHGMHLMNVCFSWLVIAKANKYLMIKNKIFFGGSGIK